MRVSFHLIKNSFVGAVGGLLFGFDTAVIAGTTHSLSQTFRLRPAGLGFTVSIASWGTVLGAMKAGVPGTKIGGRGALRIMTAHYLVSALGCAVLRNWDALLVSLRRRIASAAYSTERLNPGHSVC